MRKPEDETLSKAYKTLNEEEVISSPTDLDALILSKAKEAVLPENNDQEDQPEKRENRLPLLLRTYSPHFSVAAVLALSFSIILELPEDDLNQYPQTPEFVLEEEMALEHTPQAMSPAMPEMVFADDALPESISSESSSEEERMHFAKKEIQAEAERKEKAKKQVHVAREKAREVQQAQKQRMQRQLAQDDLSFGEARSFAAIAEREIVDEVSIKENHTQYRENVDSWVQHIEALLDKQEMEKAKEEFILFKQAHPDNPFVAKHSNIIDEVTTLEEKGD